MPTNPESIAALRSGNKEKLRELTLEYIRDRGSFGATADEICEGLGLLHNSISPRVVELEQSGAIERLTDADGKRVKRKTRQGCNAGVMIAAEYAQCTHFRPLPEEGSGLLFDELPERTIYPD